MYTLKAENRNTGLKPKQLRRKGIIPGVLYGKDLEESLSIQFSRREATRFLRTNSAGSKVQLVIGDKKFSTLFREVTYRSASSEIEHLSFQTLLAGEIVTSTMRIVLLNKEKISGLIQQPQAEISYRTLPAHLVDTIEIDLDGMKAGDSIRISDLDVAKNPNIEILDPLDTTVLTITEVRKPVEAYGQAEGSEAEEQASEA